MSKTLGGLGVEERIERVTRYATIIHEIVEGGEASIDDVLKQTAEKCGVIPAQVRYALTFAATEGLVEVDYDSRRVRLAKSLTNA